MPQSDGRSTLKRMGFEFDGKSYNFAVNPQEYQQDEPSRSTVTQTKGGAWIDDFGAGLPIITIKGNTGFKNGLGEERFKELRDLIRRYWDTHAPGETVTKELTFHNYTDGESWIVHTDPAGFKLLRSKSNPLLFQYDMRLICLRPASQPAQAEKTAARIGNKEGNPLPKVAVENNKGQVAEKKVRSDSALYMQALPTIQQMSGIRYENKVPNSTAQALKDLQFLSSGLILLPESIDRAHEQTSLIDAYNPLFEYAVLEPYLSSLAINTFKEIASDTNDSLITREGVPENSLAHDIVYFDPLAAPLSIRLMLKAVLLEVISIAYALVNSPKTFSNNISEGDVQRVISNVAWLSAKLQQLFNENLGNQKISIETIERLRWLERALTYVLHSEDLFSRDLSSTLKDFKKAKEG